MGNKRDGCYYCFKTLNPHDREETLQSFVKCDHCNYIYHATCWDIYGKCFFCGEALISPAKISNPPNLQVKTRYSALPIKPSIVYDVKSDSQTQSASISQYVIFSIQLLRALLIATLLVTIATFISIFTYRILQLSPITLNAIMEAVFKQPLPANNTFIGSIFSGIVWALLLYFHPMSLKTIPPTQGTQNAQEGQQSQQPQPAKNISTSNKKDPFVLLIAGIVSIVIFDIILFNFNLQDILGFRVNWLLPHQEVLYAQGTMVLLMLLFVLLQGKLAPINAVVKANYPQVLTNLYGLARLFLVSVALSMLVAYLCTYKLSVGTDEKVFFTSSLRDFSIAVTLPVLGAFVSGIVIASVLYWPPKCRQVKWKLGIIRLLLVVACIVGIGLMYRNTAAPTIFLNTLIYSSSAIIIMTPVQYALS